ncbi:MAG: MBL fold metallo-hydrolase [Nitrososphaerota archaeon]|nr:MBL fold metallo-hydrolase [Nitrososphaerota archaeon]MDG6922652.1 MBL fold metallo-hydrolase [Nitrososphaerota archaeon]
MTSFTPTTDSIPALRVSNAYLFQSSGTEIVLIDSGLPGNAKRIADFMKSRDIEPKSLALILLTHPDIDHSGSVWELKEKYCPNTRVAIHEVDAPRLSGEKKLKEMKGIQGFMMGAVSPFMKFHPVKPDILLKDNEDIADLHVIHAPGHTLGSVCFYYKKERSLFSGDTLITDSNNNVVYSGKSMSYDLEMTKRSVQSKLKDLDLDMIFPGHGSAVASGASEKIRMLCTQS